MQLHTFMLGIDVARRALLLISIPPFRTGGAGKPAPKIITCILYGVMISYGKCLVNYAQEQKSTVNKMFMVAREREEPMAEEENMSPPSFHRGQGCAGACGLPYHL